MTLYILTEDSNVGNGDAPVLGAFSTLQKAISATNSIYEHGIAEEDKIDWIPSTDQNAIIFRLNEEYIAHIYFVELDK